MNSVFTGFETNEITLKKNGELEQGNAVIISDGAVAAIPADGEAFCGVCSVVRGDYASVILHGCAKTSYSGTVPTVGFNKLSSDGNGGIKLDDTNGREYLVVSVDTVNCYAEILI
ncbi:MAG: hypothetical protein IJ491_00215 [Clostridia bacterium]|nr:hypothetical protein [Clostridia bacterium]